MGSDFGQYGLWSKLQYSTINALDCRLGSGPKSVMTIEHWKRWQSHGLDRCPMANQRSDPESDLSQSLDSHWQSRIDRSILTLTTMGYMHMRLKRRKAAKAVVMSLLWLESDCVPARSWGGITALESSK